MVMFQIRRWIKASKTFANKRKLIGAAEEKGKSGREGLRESASLIFEVFGT